MTRTFVGADGDEPVGGDEAVDQAGAGGVEVERAARQAELVLHRRGRGRHGAVGGGGGEDEQRRCRRVDAGHARVAWRPASTDRPGGGAADVALADAGAFDDPVVVGVERLLEVVVGDDLVGQGGAPPGDHRASDARRYCWHLVSPRVRHDPSLRSQAIGWRGVTRSVSSAM